MKNQWIDLSHTIREGLQTYKGLPAPLVCDFISRQQSAEQYADQSSFVINRIDMVTNTGTYIDCPFHRFEGGDDFGTIPLERLADLPGIVIRVPYQTSKSIGLTHIEGKPIAGKVVLFHTGWDAHFNTSAYYEDHPHLTDDVAHYLIDQGAIMAGIDSHNIDNTAVNRRPVHTALLGAGVLIVEHLTRLDLLPENGFRFSAVPPKFAGVGSFPVRAMARLTHNSLNRN